MDSSEGKEFVVGGLDLFSVLNSVTQIDGTGR